MKYNTIIGNSLDANKALIFNQLENEQCYISFGREKESWGNCTLVNISLKENTVIKDIISFDDNTGKFVDRNVFSYEDSNTYVHIYKTASGITDFNSTLSNYIRIEELTTINLKLCFINSNWAVIKGLPYNYNDFMNTNQGEKFYIVRNNINFYSLNPDNFSAISKINTKLDFNYNDLNTPCNLKLIDGETHNDCIFYLNKNTNILGEILISGLIQENINITEQDLIQQYSIYNNSPITSSTPYFVLYNSALKYKTIISKMYLIKYQTDSVDYIWHTDDNTQYFLFKIVTDDNQIYFTKITKDSPINGLAIYNETLSNYGSSDNIISDTNPPDFDNSYLKTQSIHSSIFDIKGLLKIKKYQEDYNDDFVTFSKVSFAKEITSTNEKNNYIAQGFSELNDTKKIDQLQITTEEYVTHYGNINRNPKSVDGNYISGVSRIYLFNNHKFVLGDVIQIRYWNTAHTEYNPLQTQTKNSLDEDLTVIGISYEMDNSYIDINGVTTLSILFDETSPDEAISSVDAAIISNSTNISQNRYYAVCSNIDEAFKYNMDSVMVEMKIPYNTLDVYTGLYRQLCIWCNPKYYDFTMKLCTDDSYTNNLFDIDNHKYDLGTLLFISNKTPVYRKFINNKEVFKLIF